MQKYMVQVIGRNLLVQVSGQPKTLSVIGMCPVQADSDDAARRTAIERVTANAKAKRPFKNIACDPPTWAVTVCEESNWDDSWSNQAPGLIWVDSGSVQSRRRS